MHNFLFLTHSQVAAYGIMYNTSMLVYMPVTGAGQGIQPVFGFNYSAGNYVLVRSTLKYSIIYAIIFANGMFLVIELFWQSNYKRF